MATCDDRQLTQTQREDGFQQQAAVQRAVRPFPSIQLPTNDATAQALKQLVDYINRDLLPVVQAGRSRVNEIHAQVAQNAPSANPLGFVFSAQTANADPTTGFVRLDSSTQSAATTLRVSEFNRIRVSISPWLDIMSGSATVPLGTLTLVHANHPDRFIRATLASITDQGTYRDLALTIVEASSTNPFVDGDSVLVAFTPGVASGGVALAPGTVPTWSSVLAAGNNTGGHQPTIDNSDSLLFAAGSLGIEATTDLTVNVTDTLTLEAGADLHVHPTGQLHLGHETLTASIHQGALGAIEVVTSDAYSASATGNASVTAGGNIPLQAGGFVSIGAGGATQIVFQADGSWDLGGTTPGAAGQYLRSSGAAAAPTWASLALAEFPTQASDTFLGNVSGSPAVPSAVNLSTLAGSGLGFASHTLSVNVGSSLAIATDNVVRAALTGDVTASQDSNATTIAAHAVTNGKLAQMGTDTFKGNISGATADAADVLLVSLASASVAYDNITTHTFQRAALTGDVTASTNSNATTIANSAVTNAKMANMVTDTVKGNIGGTTAAPSDVPLANLDSTSIIYDATSHTFQRAALTGDVTSSQNSNATTIAAHAVTNSKLAQMTNDTFKGNVSGATADASDVALSSLAGTGLSFGSHAFSVSSTWAQVLANGATSGGHDPVITAGDGIVFGTDPGGSSMIRGGSGLSMLAAGPVGITGTTFEFVASGVGNAYFQSTGGVQFSRQASVLGSIAQDEAVYWAKRNSAIAQSGSVPMFTEQNGVGSIDHQLLTTDANSVGTTQIANSAVTNAKLANMASGNFKGNVSGSTQAPSDVPISTLASTGLTFTAPGALSVNFATQANLDAGTSSVLALVPSLLGFRPAVATLGTAVAATASTARVSSSTYTIPANSLVSGSTYLLFGCCVATRTSTATACNLTVDIQVAGVSQVSTGAIAIATAAGNYGGFFLGFLTCYTTGSSGTAIVQLYSIDQISGGGHQSVSNINATFTINTTTTNTLSLGGTMSAAVAGLSQTWSIGSVVRLR